MNSLKIAFSLLALTLVYIFIFITVDKAWDQEEKFDRAIIAQYQK